MAQSNPKPCDCDRYPNMHDSAGVCVNWERHIPASAKTPAQRLPPFCPTWHYQFSDGARKSNG